MLLNGILFATISGIMGYLLYVNGKRQLGATAAKISRKEIAQIVQENRYFKLSRVALWLLPVAGVLVGLLRNSRFVYLGLAAMFLLLAAFTVTFLIGGSAIDRFKRR